MIGATSESTIAVLGEVKTAQNDLFENIA